MTVTELEGDWELAFPESDSAFGEVVGSELNGDGITTQNPDVMLPHFSRDVGNDFMPVFQLDPELGIGEGFNDRTLHFDTFFFRHKGSPDSGNAEFKEERGQIQTCYTAFAARCKAILFPGCYNCVEAF